nr:MAG TPA_asm: hypothetical protein [Caudoviricetes sp.]
MPSSAAVSRRETMRISRVFSIILLTMFSLYSFIFRSPSYFYLVWFNYTIPSRKVKCFLQFSQKIFALFLPFLCPL